MSFINYMAREINCKFVYYGPGLCGKTTNLQYIYERTNPEHEGEDDLASRPRRSGRSSSTSCRCRSARSAASRRASTSTRCRAGLLRRVAEAHLEGRRRRHLRRRLADRAHGGEPRVGREPADEPRRAGLLARQAAVRRPVQQARPAERRGHSTSCADAQQTNVPDFEAVARTGVGVFDTLKAVAKLVLTELKRGAG
jgi:hypothetical protein